MLLNSEIDNNRALLQVLQQTVRDERVAFKKK